jgi:hypothetical protein
VNVCGVCCGTIVGSVVRLTVSSMSAASEI